MEMIKPIVKRDGRRWIIISFYKRMRKTIRFYLSVFFVSPHSIFGKIGHFCMMMHFFQEKTRIAEIRKRKTSRGELNLKEKYNVNRERETFLLSVLVVSPLGRAQLWWMKLSNVHRQTFQIKTQSRPVLFSFFGLVLFPSFYRKINLLTLLNVILF